MLQATTANSIAAASATATATALVLRLPTSSSSSSSSSSSRNNNPQLLLPRSRFRHQLWVSSPLFFSPPHRHHHHLIGSLNIFHRATTTPSPNRRTPQVNGESPLLLDEQSVAPMISVAYTSKSVHVKFMVRKECSFGQQFLLVGNVPRLGQWDPTKAVPLEWSDGHMWRVGLDLSAEEIIHFKLILQSSPGEIEWQPGPNRVLQTWDTTKTIVVLEDWEDDEKQKIEEDQSVVSIDEMRPAPRDQISGTTERDDDEESLLISQVAEKKLTDCKCSEVGQARDLLVPGLEPDPDSEVEGSSPGSAAEVKGSSGAFPIPGAENNVCKAGGGCRTCQLEPVAVVVKKG